MFLHLKIEEEKTLTKITRYITYIYIYSNFYYL